jgi:hypothetical protein
MESFVLPENVEEFLSYLYLFPLSSVTLTDGCSADGYRIIDSNFSDRQRMRADIPHIVL